MAVSTPNSRDGTPVSVGGRYEPGMMGQQVQWPAGTQRVAPLAEGQFIALAGELL